MARCLFVSKLSNCYCDKSWFPILIFFKETKSERFDWILTLKKDFCDLLGQIYNRALRCQIVTALICTLKSDFEVATWDFIYCMNLKKCRVATTQIFFWAGTRYFFFLIYLMKPSFFSGCHPEKIQFEFYPIFFRVPKAPIFSKLKIGCRLRGVLFHFAKSVFQVEN